MVRRLALVFFVGTACGLKLPSGAVRLGADASRRGAILAAAAAATQLLAPYQASADQLELGGALGATCLGFGWCSQRDSNLQSSDLE